MNAERFLKPIQQTDISDSSHQSQIFTGLPTIPIDIKAGAVEFLTVDQRRKPSSRNTRQSPMPFSVNLAVRSAMIPWIIALTLLFGISTVTPGLSPGEKHGRSKEASASQVADDGQFPRNSAAPLLKLPSILWTQCGLSAPSSSFLRIDGSQNRLVRKSSACAHQGRAPPLA